MSSVPATTLQVAQPASHVSLSVGHGRSGAYRAYHDACRRSRDIYYAYCKADRGLPHPRVEAMYLWCSDEVQHWRSGL